MGDDDDLGVAAALARFGANMRGIREGVDLSRDEVALACRIPKADLAAIEAGEVNPRLRTFISLLALIDLRARMVNELLASDVLSWDEVMTTFGAGLRTAREAREVPLSEMARRSAEAESDLREIEEGRREATVIQAIKFRSILDVEVPDLIASIADPLLN